ncbi:MAG: trimethylamine methyltransferase family protein, partial [Deltaproteobacteria bacterium]|nr:trimethylamine methyltransferase family protein [Deltaproteobacteria bacterium]
GTGSDLQYTYDPFSGQLRLTTTQDVANAARVVDYLPHMDFQMSYGTPSEVPLEQVFQTEFVEMTKNSTKPIIFTSDNGPDSRRIIEMAAVVAGGLDKLRDRPYLIGYSQPTSPLRHSGNGLSKLLVCAELGIPVCYPPGLFLGGNCPTTMAGAITQSLAEALSALVIHQAKNPKEPIILGGSHGCLDMKTSIFVYASPEKMLTEAVLGAIYQSFGLPTWGHGGCTDAQILDQQAGAEFGLLTLWAPLSGVNLAHDVGYMGSGMIGDLRAVVFNNELNGYVRHALNRGLVVNDETRAIEIMERLGPGCNFLTDKHTFQHFKTELWFPELSNRSRLETWTQQGRKTMNDRLAEKVKEILESHQPQPLSSEVARELDQMLAD